MIAEENVVVTITKTGYIKRIPVEEYRVQRRGGKGLKGMETREEDYVTDIFMTSTKTTLLIFTDKGKVYWSKVYRLPMGTRTSKGKAIANVVQLQDGEKVMAVMPVDQFTETKYVVMLTKQGVIKKTALDAFSNPRQAGIIALTTDLDDCVIDAKMSDGKSDIFIATREGMSIRFSEDDVRPMGRSARGVRGINLAKTDVVVGLEILAQDSKKTILMVTEGGYGKRSALEEYRTQGRGGVGIITQKTTDKVGNVVGARLVDDAQQVILTTDRGQNIRMKVSDISLIGRNTQGVRLINLGDREELVTGFAVVDEEMGEVEAPPNPQHH